MHPSKKRLFYRPKFKNKLLTVAPFSLLFRRALLSSSFQQTCSCKYLVSLSLTFCASYFSPTSWDRSGRKIFFVLSLASANPLGPSFPPRSIFCLWSQRTQHKIEGLWTSILVLRFFLALSLHGSQMQAEKFCTNDVTQLGGLWLVLSADESLNQCNNQSANPCRDTSSELNFAVGQSAVSLSGRTN